MKKEMMLSLVFGLCAAVSAMQPPEGKRVVVTNPIDVSRPSETVSVKWADVGVSAGDSAVRVWDVRTASPVPFQDDLCGNLIFPTPLGPRETRLFIVCSDAALPQADLSTVCWAKHIPERMDDFAWENDCFAARAYGPVIMEPEPKGQKLISSGIDIFCKCVSYPVLGKWLLGKGEGSYHKNHGEGMDNYKVGPSRGCGGLAAFGAGAWTYSINWSESRVLMTGPVRAVFELVYQPWGGFGRETRRVTIDRGQCLAKFEAVFDKVASEGLIGPGLDIARARQHDGDIRLSLQNAWIADFEPADGSAGSICTAVMLDPSMGAATAASDAMDCLCLLTEPKQKLVWWAGASWSGAGHFTSPNLWHDYVKNFAAARRAPLKVTLK